MYAQKASNREDAEDAESGNRSRATLVGDECSHRRAIPALPLSGPLSLNGRVGQRQQSSAPKPLFDVFGSEFRGRKTKVFSASVLKMAAM